MADIFRDFRGNTIRLTPERLSHLELAHPEMRDQVDRVADTLARAQRIVQFQSDLSVSLLLQILPSHAGYEEVHVCGRKESRARWIRCYCILHRHDEAGQIAMADEINVWYDADADYLEVLFDRRPGIFRETDNDAVMEKVDSEGYLVGFSILTVSALKAEPTLSFSLKRKIAG